MMAKGLGRQILTEMALGAGSEVGNLTLRDMMELAPDHGGQQDQIQEQPKQYTKLQQ